jgi:hypothetical protein
MEGIGRLCSPAAFLLREKHSLDFEYMAAGSDTDFAWTSLERRIMHCLCQESNRGRHVYRPRVLHSHSHLILLCLMILIFSSENYRSLPFSYIYFNVAVIHGCQVPSQCYWCSLSFLCTNVRL